MQVNRFQYDPKFDFMTIWLLDVIIIINFWLSTSCIYASIRIYRVLEWKSLPWRESNPGSHGHELGNWKCPREIENVLLDHEGPGSIPAMENFFTEKLYVYKHSNQDVKSQNLSSKMLIRDYISLEMGRCMRTWNEWFFFLSCSGKSNSWRTKYVPTNS
jgi:hypothetical protein